MTPEASPIMVISYWGYVALLPGLLLAVVVCVWLIPRNR